MGSARQKDCKGGGVKEWDEKKRNAVQVHAGRLRKKKKKKRRRKEREETHEIARDEKSEARTSA